MPTPEQITLVHPGVSNPFRVAPSAALVWIVFYGWQLADPNDAQYLVMPPPSPEVDVLTRDELDTAVEEIRADLTAAFSPLLTSSAPVTTNVAPVLGAVTRYDATAAPRTGALPALTGGSAPAEGASYGVQKVDASANPVTISAAGSDVFDSGGTSLTLRVQNEIRTLQVVVVGGVKMWKVMGGNTPLTPFEARLSIAEDVFDAIFDRATSESVPTLTIGTTSAIGASPVTYRPAIVGTGVAVSGWDGRTSPTEPNFYFGPGIFSTGNGGNNDYEMHGDLLPGGAPQFATWTQTVEWINLGTDRFELEVFNPTGGLQFTLEVDQETAIVRDSGETNLTGTRYLTFVFPSAQSRHIRLSSPFLRLCRLLVPTGASISKPTAITSRRVGVAICDSWGGGAGALPPGHAASRTSTYAEHLLRAMGANDRINMSIGGTGFVNGGSTNAYYTRIAAALSKNPSFLVFQASQNDNGYSIATIQAAIENVLSLTDAVGERYLLTTFWPDASHGNANTAARLAAAAHGNGVRLIDVAGAISGTTGNITAPVAAGTRNLFLQGEGQHITARGHRYIARQAFRKIAPYLFA